MALTPRQKTAMIAATYDAAKAMIDDLDHIREIIAKPVPTSGDLRRMSNLLRRLLIDSGGDLRKIAPPRLDHRLHLLAPKLDASVGQRQPWYFASVGTFGLFGSRQSTDIVVPDPQSKTIAPPVSPPYTQSRRLEYTLSGRPIPPSESNIEKTVSLPLDRFLTQPVLYYAKKWIGRADVIKFIANIASGVHSGTPKEDIVYENLHQIRQIFALLIEDGKVTLRIHHPFNLLDGEKPIDVDQFGLDYALLQIMSAARYLVLSPDVLVLEKIIASETRA
jgi:hypothetical protein